MKNRVFLLKICLAMLLGIMATQGAKAQDCDLACLGSLDFPLLIVAGDDCQATISKDQLLTDESVCPGVKRLIVRDTLNNLIADAFDVVTLDASVYLGRRLSITITDQTTGILCVSIVRITDSSEPFIGLCTDHVVSCLDDASPEALGYPSISDNCDANVDLDFVDNIDLRDCLSDTAAVIFRVWTATGSNGLSSTCTQRIRILRSSFMNVTYPADVTLPCDDPAADPSRTGVPMLQGMELMHGDLCGLTTDFMDDTIYICNDYMYRIERLWSVAETCTGFSGQHTQIILVSDDEGPAMQCPSGELVFSTDPGLCSATIAMPAITATDQCGGDITFGLSSNFGATSFAPVSGVAPGTYQVTYRATDACGNTSTCNVQVRVVDELAPIAACDDHVIVALPSIGISLLAASAFNEGSSDNCANPVFVKARRTTINQCNGINGDDSNQAPGFQEWFDDRVAFCCEDVTNGQVQVTLRVYERNPGNGPVNPLRETADGDLVGHYTECMSYVTVQDHLGPQFQHCPTLRTIQCTDEQDDLSVYGSPIVVDNCSAVTLDSTVVTNLNDCGVGEIRRFWTATDSHGRQSTCEQLIRVQNNHVMTEAAIDWPADFTFYGCGADFNISMLPDSSLAPVINWTSCGTVGVNMQEAIHNIAAPACFKILRTWTVIDWCHYNPDAPGSPGRWTHTQQIKILDNTAPVLTCPAPVTVNVGPNCQTAQVNVPLPTAVDCSPTVTFTNNSQYATNGGANASGIYPVGTTTVRFVGADGCTNTSSCTTTVTVRDLAPPALGCVHGLSATLMNMPGGVNVEIPAASLVASASDNCTPTDALKYTVSREGDQGGVPTATSIRFDCDDEGAQLINVWATDLNNNSIHCTTYVTVNDLNNLCDDSAPANGMIAGGILTEEGREVQSVMVTVNGNAPQMMYTHIDGSFQFENLPTGQSYSLTAFNNDNVLNGVTTYDLVLIGKHILGVRRLDSPYKIIAADIDRSGHISTLDIIKLRKLILSIESALPNNNTSWRFVAADYVFPDPSNPFMGYFPEVTNINSLDAAAMYVDFIAIKVGDLNDSAVANTSGNHDDSRANDDFALQLHTDHKEVEAGTSFDIPIRASYMNEWSGYQFTMEYNPAAIEVLDILSGDLANVYPEENFHHYDRESGLLTTVWNEYGEPQAGGQDVVLFTLHCRAKQSGSLKDWLFVSSRVTKAEAYTAEGEAGPVNLSFVHKSAQAEAANFELFQNRPNPWNNSTIIPFQIQEDGDVSLSVFDMAGKEVYRVERNVMAGYHEINIHRSELPANGLFYYTLQAGDQRATRKMVLTD